MSLLAATKKLLSFLRWRLKLIRMMTKVVNQITYLPRTLSTDALQVSAISNLSEKLHSEGYCALKEVISFPSISLEELKGIAKGKSFTDVSERFPLEMQNAFAQLMNTSGIQELIIEYFNGRPWLWNVAINYSDPSLILSDSQLWHFDYGDTKQLHFMLYFSDVDTDCGPFTFLDAITSSRVRRSSLIIERMTDLQLQIDFDINTVQSAIRLLGVKGNVFIADPGRVMHQGARCSKPRMVMFVTFTTPSPMSKGGGQTISDSTRRSIWESFQDNCEVKLKKDVFI